MAPVKATLKIIILFTAYIAVIIAKIAMLYLNVRSKLWFKRFIYKWGFKLKLRKYGVPDDLKRELINVYSQRLNSSLKLPGVLSGLRLLRRGWRLRRA